MRPLPALSRPERRTRLPRLPALWLWRPVPSCGRCGVHWSGAGAAAAPGSLLLNMRRRIVAVSSPMPPNIAVNMPSSCCSTAARSAVSAGATHSAGQAPAEASVGVSGGITLSKAARSLPSSGGELSATAMASPSSAIVSSTRCTPDSTTRTSPGNKSISSTAEAASGSTLVVVVPSAEDQGWPPLLMAMLAAQSSQAWSFSAATSAPSSSAHAAPSTEAGAIAASVVGAIAVMAAELAVSACSRLRWWRTAMSAKPARSLSSFL